MSRIVIFGNSGSGKSTLAAALALEMGLAHLDLDTLAWDRVSVTQRRADDEVSLRRHRELFSQFGGEKVEHTENFQLSNNALRAVREDASA